MRVEIQDKEALLAISPLALSSYARSLGWKKRGVYRKYGDIYNAKNRPEIMIPNIQELDDYATVTSTLIRIFSEVTNTDEISLYHDLITYDRDAIRVRVTGGTEDGVGLAAAIELLSGTRDMLLAAACALQCPEPYYDPQKRAEAQECLNRIRVACAEQGSFAIVALTPPVASQIEQQADSRTVQESFLKDRIVTSERQLAMRLAESLAAIEREVRETSIVDKILEVASQNLVDRSLIQQGVSVELCKSLKRMIELFSEQEQLEVCFAWARTDPVKEMPDSVFFNQESMLWLDLVERNLGASHPRGERDFREEQLVFDVETALRGLTESRDPLPREKRGLHQTFPTEQSESER